MTMTTTSTTTTTSRTTNDDPTIGGDQKGGRWGGNGVAAAKAEGGAEGGAEGSDGKSQTKEEKVASLVFRTNLTAKVILTHLEAHAYLEMADWDANAAVENVEADFAWSTRALGVILGVESSST